MSPAPNFATAPFGPFTQGLWETGNPSAPDLAGALKQSAHWYVNGKECMQVRPGLVAQLTLMDDQGTPAAITNVCCVQPFTDGAIAIGYSLTTEKCYLYRLNDTLTGWYDHTGAAQTTAVVSPIGAMWTSMLACPEVLCAEGLGTLYIANTGASSSSALVWPTMTWVDKTWNGSGPVSFTPLAASGTYVSNVPTAGTDTAYFLGVLSYQQALWGWGYDQGTTAATGYNPCLLRFSSPNFGILFLTDSFTIGDRVNSLRERVITGGVAGESLFFASAETLVRIIGQGRDSWVKQPIDRSFGVVGPKAAIAVGEYWYYYSPRGPMRIEGLPQAYGLPPKPEPLYDAVYSTVEGIGTEATMVAFFDPDTDTVGWVCDNGNGTGVRTMVTYDTRRSRFVTSGADLGVAVRCAGNVKPIFASTATPAIGPAGPPTAPFVTSVTTDGAQLNWTPGDAKAQTIVTVSLATDTDFISPVIGPVTIPAAGNTNAGGGSYAFASTAISPGTAYIWEVVHILNGELSAYLAPPTSGTAFTTIAVLTAPVNVTAQETYVLNTQKQPQPLVTIRWGNTDAGASTQIYASATGATGSFYQIGQVGPSVASTQIQYGVGQTPPQYWACVAVQSGFQSSPLSNVAAL